MIIVLTFEEYDHTYIQGYTGDLDHAVRWCQKRNAELTPYELQYRRYEYEEVQLIEED